MLKNKRNSTKKLIPCFWLAIGFLLTIFSNGSLAIPIGSWLGLVCLIHFYRFQNRLSAVFLVSGIYIVANTISYWETNPVPIGLRLSIFGFFFTIYSLLFFADYFFSKRLIGFSKTFVLPLLAVLIEFAFARFSPYAASGALAYTQFDNFPLLQLASLTGMWGIIFVMYWFFSIIPLFFEKDFSFQKYKTGILSFLLIFVLIWGFGSIRLRFFQPQSQTVKVSGITIDRLAEDATIRALTLTEREAKAGSKIIFWQEAGLLLKSEEQAREIVNQASMIAKEYDVYIFPAIVIQAAPRMPGINKTYGIDNKGVIRFEYLKSHEVPGGLSLVGPAQLPVLQSPYGTISTAICYDADFPQFIRQTSIKGIDILLVPSSDWKEINPFHTNSMALRAVENGISLFRQSYACLSKAFNGLGEPLGSMDWFHTDDRVLTVHMPTKRMVTFYGLTGDWLPWLSIGGLGWLIWLARRKKGV